MELKIFASSWRIVSFHCKETIGISPKPFLWTRCAIFNSILQNDWKRNADCVQELQKLHSAISNFTSCSEIVILWGHYICDIVLLKEFFFSSTQFLFWRNFFSWLMIYIVQCPQWQLQCSFIFWQQKDEKTQNSIVFLILGWSENEKFIWGLTSISTRHKVLKVSETFNSIKSKQYHSYSLQV